NGKIVTQEIVKNGPVVFMVTTTKATLHAENETRMLSLEIDDTKEQTAKVLEKIAVTVGKNTKPDVTAYYRWHDFQIVLREAGKSGGGWKVVVPFAEDVADFIRHKEAVRLRRDFTQILLAVKAHALLHQFLRKRTEQGEIIADLDLDYGPVAGLIGHIVAEAS